MMFIEFNLMNVFQGVLILAYICILIKQAKIMKIQEKTLEILNRKHFYQNINSDPDPPQNEKEWQEARRIYYERENKKLEEERKKKAWLQLLSEREDTYKMLVEKNNKGLTEKEFIELLDEHNRTKGRAD